VVGEEVAGVDFGREVLCAGGDCGKTLFEDTNSFFEEFAVGGGVGLAEEFEGRFNGFGPDFVDLSRFVIDKRDFHDLKLDCGFKDGGGTEMQLDQRAMSGGRHILRASFLSFMADRIVTTARELSARPAVAFIVSSFLSNVLARIGR
jgi:hypothetical protein